VLGLAEHVGFRELSLTERGWMRPARG
jgi:hypothetical protein